MRIPHTRIRMTKLIELLYLLFELRRSGCLRGLE